MAGPSKEYGLIRPIKAHLQVPKRANIFGDDSDLDEDDGVDWVKKSLQAEAEKNRVKKQARLNAERALEEDPTIYQYDEIYSTIHVDPKVKKEEKKNEKPKYITTLLKTAERRKKENELRIERTVQKEREAEGEMFKDKEKFVTASYKAKLQEMKNLEEEQKEIDRLETIGDVTKQGDVSGFYRYLYEQTFDTKKTDAKKENGEMHEVKKETENKAEQLKENVDKDDSSANDSSSDEGDDKNKNVAVKILTRIRKVKQSRQRVVEASESEPEPEPENKEKDEKEKENLNSKGETKEVIEKEPEDEKMEDKCCKRSISPDVKELQNVSSKKKKQDEDKPERKKAEKRVSIWVKRTVGPVLDAALQRYFARKALRVSGS